MKGDSRFGFASLLSGLTRAFALSGEFVSPLDGRTLTPSEVETEVRGWESTYPLRFRKKDASSAEELVLRKRDCFFRLEEAQWFGDQRGAGVVILKVAEIRNGMERHFAHTPWTLRETLLCDGAGKVSKRESPSRLLVSLGLSDGIAGESRHGSWQRLPDISLLEANIRDRGGELPLRLIRFLPGDGGCVSPVSEPEFPVYDLSRTTRLIFESVRWDPCGERYVVSVATATVSGSVNREELGVGEIRDRIGKIPGERGRLFWYWFTRPRS